MDSEMMEVMKVWLSALAGLVYCYLVSFNIPKGMFRFFSLLPIIYVFVILPFNISLISLASPTAFFLTWLANFKLLLFSFDEGPLCSNPSISLSHFISIASLPIMIKENKKTSKPQENQEKKETPSSKTPPKPYLTRLNYFIKLVMFFILGPLYEHKEEMNSKVLLLYYCFLLYLGLELILAFFAVITKFLLGLELEPQFNEPYMSTSLQDFWGCRWNLMVTNILRPSVYLPSRHISTKIMGRKWAALPAIFATFLISGLMHELIFLYMGRVSPTWEVTGFFALHGLLVVIEIILKKGLRWKLHPVISVPLTLWILIVTAEWLFFPPLLRCDADVIANRELTAAVNYFKNFGKSILASNSF